MKMGNITAERPLTPAEAMGIKIGQTVIKEDAYLWNLNPSPIWDLSRVVYRKNRITLSAGDAELDASLWHAMHAADINARFVEVCGARS